MTPENIERMWSVVRDVKRIYDDLPSASEDNGHALFDAARPLIDAACRIQTELCLIWGEERPAKPPSFSSPLRKVTADDLLI
jgi:hypothetical protein